MEHHTTTSRTEAERLLGVAEKLLRNRDLSGSRDFAILAQETEPLLDGSDQILAIAEVLLSAENKKSANNQPEYYSILQIPQRTEDTDLIKKQYRRLALLLHPDKNKFPFADSAFRLVSEAWGFLSDPGKKSAYDNELLSRFVKVDLVAVNNSNYSKKQRKNQNNPRNSGNPNQKLPVRRSGRHSGASASNIDGDGVDLRNAGNQNNSTDARNNNNIHHNDANMNNHNNASNVVGSFWTTCPYCYNLFEFPNTYLGCCLRCDNDKCKRAFTASKIMSMPPLVPGKEAYYCCWGFFPMGFVPESGGGGGSTNNGVFAANWMPPMFGDRDVTDNRVPPDPVSGGPVAAEPQNVVAAGGGRGGLNSSVKKKRGRPRRNM